MQRPDIDPAKFRPNSDHILLLKCVNEEPDGIVTPDKSRDRTNFLEIIAVGPDCKLFTPDTVGAIVHAPDWSHALTNQERVFGRGYWMCRERGVGGKPVLQPFVLVDG